MDKSGCLVIVCLIATSIVASRALPIDYEDVAGNPISEKVVRLPDNEDNQEYYDRSEETVKRDPELVEIGQKRNIISALRAKMRRSHPNEIEDRLRFSPVLSVDALGNLNGFFDNLATNLHTMENRNLLPNQMRLLGEQENRPRESFGHSAAFINSVRAYQSPAHIRKLMDYTPDSHRNSNFYNPVLTRIGLGK